MADWLGTLKSIRSALLDNSGTSGGRSTTVRPTTASVAQRLRGQRDLSINLGIDFGTSFTKVCFRDLGAGDVGIASLGGTSGDPIAPSVVAIDDSGRLTIGDGKASGGVQVPYLKMRLAGAPVGQSLPTVDGVNLNDALPVRALASWFLATVIARAQTWLAGHEASRLKNRRVLWSANVGVPVSDIDSDAKGVFEEVLRVAWTWVQDRTIPPTLTDAMSGYGRTRDQGGDGAVDAHAVPEIAAAVHSFIMSREAVPGVYVYFDVGGGTVDGVAFQYMNRDGDRRINFYSGAVKPLGVSALAAWIGGGPMVDATTLDRLLAKSPRATDLARSVQQLVGNVVMTAKWKDGRDWKRDKFQSLDFERKFIGSLPKSRIQPLVVFLGGGGARSIWYAKTIAATHSAFKQDNAGIPEYAMRRVMAPRDLNLEQIHGHDFGRFAVAYGLSTPDGAGPEIGLPSQFGPAPPLPPREQPGVIEYGNSKDALT